MTKHPFHIVDFSPWPLTGSLSSLFTVTGLASWKHKYDNSFIFIGFSLMLPPPYFNDGAALLGKPPFKESPLKKSSSGYVLGMLLFISSEAFFFLAFFWAFFHASLHPSLELGSSWPPIGISALNPLEVPLLNTMILLSSGCSITWAHMALINSSWLECVMSMWLTVLLGIYFSLVQYLEYVFAPFTLADSVYGSTFFVATGFHGLHVLIGTTFIAVMLFRHHCYHFNNDHHFGFEASAWYWHFVDVVWLFLFLCIYWWGYEYFCKLC
uniref:Cytochrome c oxidase subunit 3 n=1 Tax=Flaccisagitta enflata TaxID=366393 RepID=D3DKN6_9BILA|nr:cytochrome c oxidase subunit III [Flaccisagitta enflata]BAI68185.1 cytochrome oxidase subunit 3 [Flaccisagitta enflata]